MKRSSKTDREDWPKVISLRSRRHQTKNKRFLRTALRYSPSPQPPQSISERASWCFRWYFTWNLSILNFKSKFDSLDTKSRWHGLTSLKRHFSRKFLTDSFSKIGWKNVKFMVSMVLGHSHRYLVMLFWGYWKTRLGTADYASPPARFVSSRMQFNRVAHHALISKKKTIQSQ